VSLRRDLQLAALHEALSKALFTTARLMGSTATDFGLDAGKVTATLSGIG